MAGLDAGSGHAGGDAGSYTPTALSRWSLLDHKLPAADTVKRIHIYDFDNTLFKTPMPNTKLWNAATIGSLSSLEAFSTGGWWHDVRILSATGQGLEKEEPRAWDGWWNEHIAELARLSEQESGALSVLLTGRAERTFGDLVQRMAKSKGLAFDMIVLKPAAGPNNEKFKSTMTFKQAYLTAVMETYAGATEIRIYEDRPRHVDGFREFLKSYNEQRQNRSLPPPLPAITAEVIPIAQMATTLDPVIEVAEVQHMVNCHNTTGGGRRGRLVLTKTVFFTGYLIKEIDTERLLGLLGSHIPSNISRRDLKYHGNSIMISPRNCPPHILAKAGGMGSKVTWRVEAMGNLDNTLWAVKVRPATPNTSYHTAESVPLVVLAVCRGARPHEASRIRKWTPVADGEVFEFETTVGEKAILRVESEHASSSQDNSNNYSRDESDGQNAGGHAKRARVGAGPYNNGSNSFRGRGGVVQTGVAGFAPPTGPRGGAGRGYYNNNNNNGNQGGGRGGRGNYNGGNFRGAGRGNFRGGMAGRGGRGGAGAGASAGAGVNAGAGASGAPAGAAGNSNAGRPRNGYYQYQSLDDAGPAQQSSQGMQRQQIVYDEE